MSGREEILARIRASIGPNPEDYATIARDYRQSPSLPLEQRLSLFTERLRDYDSTVHRASESELPETISRILTARSLPRIVIPADFPKEWLPAGIEFTLDRNLSYADLDRLEGAITACTIAIALTGTIVLQGRRALTLIPDYHLCIVRENQILETVPEAVRFLNATGTQPTTFISGPSATSDIEMTRIKGVHGPRTLEVVIVV